jgi:cobalt-zinc-cadmium efflux system outer membrane protein
MRSNERARTRTISVILMLALGSGLPAAALAQSLTLNDVLSRAAETDPSARVNAARVEAAGASVRAADFGPRPRVGVDMEDFAGSGPYRRADGSQTTAYYEQVWERGGKRDARVQFARSEQSVAQQRARLRMLDLFEKVQGAWIEALAADAAVIVAQERLVVAETAEKEVARRVGRALDPLFAGERARTALAQARIAVDQALETSRLARVTLATWWGGTEAVRLDPGQFQINAPMVNGSSNMPDLDLLAAERDSADANLRLAEANTTTDPTFRVGVRRFGQGDNVALVAGASIPVGVNSAGRPAIDRAQAERVAAEGELAAARLQRKREADRLHASRVTIASEVSRIDGEVIPTATRAATMVRDGYNRGGSAFTFLEVADAQRSLLEAKTRRIELLRRFHLDGARLDRLSGRHLSLLSGEEKR